MYGYIYITTCLVNGTGYVGKRKGEFTTEYLGSGKLIQRAIRKYGKQYFDVQMLCTASSKEELNKLERYFIDVLNCVESDRYYNLMDGGNGGKVVLTEEGKLKKSEKIAERLTTFYATEEGKKQREQLRMLKTGVTYSDEVNKKKGKAGTANNNYGNKNGFKDANHPQAKRFSITTPDGVTHDFECAKYAIKWAKETLGISRGVLLELAYSGKPYDSWQRKKYHLKGTTATYI